MKEKNIEGTVESRVCFQELDKRKLESRPLSRLLGAVLEA